MAIVAPVERFWPKVRKTETCWLWTRQKNNRGYGCFSVHHRLFYAHRFSWTLAHGPIPQGLSVLHRCDTPACVNPEHLFLGTQKDNMQDCLRKQRMNGAWKAGERHRCAKLTEAAVRSILIDTRSCAKIAREHGISRGYVTNLKKRRIWKCLDA